MCRASVIIVETEREAAMIRALAPESALPDSLDEVSMIHMMFDMIWSGMEWYDMEWFLTCEKFLNRLILLCLLGRINCFEQGIMYV